MGQACAVARRVDAVDASQQLEAAPHRQMVPQLRTLSEHDPYVMGELTALTPGHQMGHFGVARTGTQNAGQNLQSGGFSGPVRADEGDAFAFADGERDVANRGNLGYRPGAEQGSDRAAAERLACPEVLAQAVDEDRHHRSITPSPKHKAPPVALAGLG